MLICITAAFMNKNQAAMRRHRGVSFKGPAAVQIRVITIRTIFVFFPGNGERELLNLICRRACEAAAEEKEAFQAAAAVGTRRDAAMLDLLPPPAAEQRGRGEIKCQSAAAHTTSERHYGKSCN